MVAARQSDRAGADGHQSARACAACARRRPGSARAPTVGLAGVGAHRRTVPQGHGHRDQQRGEIRRRGRHGPSPSHRPSAARRAAAGPLARKPLAGQLFPLRRRTGFAARFRRTDGGANMSDEVRVEKEGPVTTVTINRPNARNAVNDPTAAGLVAAFEEFDADDEASVAVLWGDNGTFCAGADLKAFGTPESNVVHRTGPGPMGPSRMVLSKPVIAAVSGYAVAGGLELADRK